jgi:hypothetical protein
MMADELGYYEVSYMGNPNIQTPHLTRQDNRWNGAIRDIEVAVSDDPDAFGDPVAKTALNKTRTPQEISFEPTRGRYVLIRALSEVNQGPWASAAEFGLIGAGN